MNTNVKILFKSISNQIQQHIKRVTGHKELRFILGKQGWFNIRKNQSI